MRLGRHLVLFIPSMGLCGIAPAHAAEISALEVPHFSLLWALPFAGILTSIAILPLLAPHFWHAHFGKVSLFWALALLLPLILVHGFPVTMALTLHSLLLEFLPFIVVMFALYTVAGGIYLSGNLHGSPWLNTALLAVGGALANCIGTTGASMVLIRPLLRANDHRRNNVHVFIFFIFIVSNIGGALTPIGNPPIFLGFLGGVPFFWTALHIAKETLFCLALLLAAFFALDWLYFYKERHAPGHHRKDPTPDAPPLRLYGGINLLLMLAIIGTMLVCSLIDLGSVAVGGIHLQLQNLLRDVLLVCIGFISLRLTSRATRAANEFSWAPVWEVAKLFSVIFITLAPLLEILKAGAAGALAPLLAFVTGPDGAPNPAMYFWISGILSAVLDSAPSYLAFFHAAGGNAAQLTGPLAHTLAAISCGTVFLGAMTYIGNAPNFMVRSIAAHHGIKMPSFFGYIAWACLFLLPIFALVSWLFFS